ncbi:MAG: iron ABC transporter permease [Rhodospirillaceae bacterium]|nr:iron ABC transporter permease [Rhodospirillaceae bacterium]
MTLRVFIWITVAALCALLFAVSLSCGSSAIGISEAVHAMAAVLGFDVTEPSLAVMRIVVDLRLPRTLLALATGVGLSVVGVLLQTVTRNDLADPFLFGLSSGAAAGAVSVITIFGDRFGNWTLSIAAFMGALLATLVVLLLSFAQRRQGPERLILAGLAVSFLFSALTTYMVFSGDQRAAQSVLFWTAGGFGRATWNNLPLGAAGAALALFTGVLFRHRLNALLAGEDAAQFLGVNVKHLRMWIFALSALATASLVALSGVIGFVGLMVPHLARALVGGGHNRLVPASAMLGATIMLGGDIVSRVVLAPQELPVGIVTTAGGALFILVLLLRR